MSHGAIVLAAGYGSLRGPNGRSFPKLLEQVGSNPMLARVVRTALAAGLGPCVVVVNRMHGPTIQTELTKLLPTEGLTFVEQQDRCGSGDAALQGALALQAAGGVEHCTVIYGDMPLWRSETVAELSRLHRERAAPMSMATYRFAKGQATWFERFARVIHDKEDRIVKVTEVSALLAWQLRSMTCVNPALMAFGLPWMLANLPKLAFHDKGDAHPAETYLPELAELAVNDGGITELLLSDPVELLGVNTQEELERVRAQVERTP